jgi:hypothetical protein
MPVSGCGVKVLWNSPPDDRGMNGSNSNSWDVDSQVCHEKCLEIDGLAEFVIWQERLIRNRA